MEPKTNRSPDLSCERSKENPPQIQSRGKNSNLFRRPEGRREHRGHLPPGRHRPQPVLQMEQVVSGG